MDMLASAAARAYDGTPTFNDFYPPVCGTRPMKIGLFDVSTIVDVISVSNPGIDALLRTEKGAILGDKVTLSPDEALRAKSMILPRDRYPEHWRDSSVPQSYVAPQYMGDQDGQPAAVFSPGGTAVNVGYMIKQLLGPKVELHFLGLTGNAGGMFDALSAEACRQAGIQCDIDLRDKVWTEAVSYVVKYPSDRIIAKVGGDPRDFLTADLFNRPEVEARMKSLDVIIVSGNLEAKAPEFAARLFDRISYSGATFIYMLPTDRKWSRKNTDKINAHMRDADLVLANAEEFAAGFGMDIDDEKMDRAVRDSMLHDAFDKAKAIFAAHNRDQRSYAFLHRQNAMVTDGSRGAYGIDAYRREHFPPNLVHVLNSLGAGDATFGAKISGCISGVSIGQSIVAAQKIASLKLGFDAARLPDALVALERAAPELALPFHEIQESVRTGRLLSSSHGGSWADHIAFAPR